ncbi:MAG: efflux RND transporter periplasmic adaptor subunit [Planctomycetota bacterium]|jgi:RND family efflux transporter MFP subunit|nr:efflux RND transporter periplasmic adaptor subunit [Planctomycetota bacterium]
MAKYLLILVLVAGAAYVAWLYVNKAPVAGRSGQSATSVAVETARVKERDLSDRAIFTGAIRASERFDAAFRLTESVREIRVDAGDVVRRGEVLAVLDDEEYTLAVEQAEANLAVARANANDARMQLDITQRDFDRAKRLHEQTVIAAQEYDRYAAAHQAQAAKCEVAEAQVKLVESTLETARLRLKHTRLVADWTDGSDWRIVAKRYVDPGAIAGANDPILAIINIDTVKAVINVNEKEYTKIAADFPVILSTDAFPGREFTGRVGAIAQELGDLSREAEITIVIDNPDHALKPGMFIRAEMVFSRHDAIPAAPLEAVVRREDGDRGVFVVDRELGEVVFKSITEGILDRGWVELVGGGDLLGSEVVVMGQHLLKEGSKVTFFES